MKMASVTGVLVGMGGGAGIGCIYLGLYLMAFTDRGYAGAVAFVLGIVLVAYGATWFLSRLF